ncbi:hypothetical protein Gotri_001050 [Gossypium trilobum]|uniref:CCHC-type domain-containing protein n=1 Tax=Gossypium trilobum TaxID=34281 RepID=A0A7J9FDG4_9ROSI|nr:hypothetical protein [Gossypium trilobum]
MEDAMASLRLLDDEEEAIHEVAREESFVYQFCMVGRCLTNSVVHFPSLRNTMVDLWHPIRGICITEVGEKRYLFQFFNEIDFDRVKAGTLWFFNNHLLILQTISEGVNPTVVELKFTEFWIQVHDLPPESMNESMAKQFGNFCGKFLEYDTSIPTLGTQTFLRTRVCLDVNAPLKRKKKVLFGKSLVVYARFKYEKLSLFCFICGRLGHGESFCPLRLQIEPSKIIFGWDLSLRAVTRRRNITESKLLRTDNWTMYVLDKTGNSNPNSLLTEEKRSMWISKGATGNQNINPNFIQLGTENYDGSSRDRSGYDGGDVRIRADGAVYGSLELVSNEEDDPIALLEGKKRQRMGESSRMPLETIGGSGFMDVSASSGDQSSRAQ